MAETHSHYMSTILAFYEISYEQKKKVEIIKLTHQMEYCILQHK